MTKKTIIKLDLDKWSTRKAERMLNFRLKWINYYFKIFPSQISLYRTHKGLHAYITMQGELVNEAIVVFQLVLESDWLRELRNWNRLATGMTTNWNLLFTRKFTIGKKGGIKYLSKERLIKTYILER